MKYKLMILGVIICTISVFFIHNPAQPYCFFVGCLIFMIGTAIRYKEVKDEKDEDVWN